MLAGRHRVTADEPPDLGGEDAGPGPYEFLLAALGACTGMTLRLYAGRRGWPLEQVEIHLEHSRRYVEDCRDCPEGEPYLDHIAKEIVLSGPLTPEQVSRLGEIAERCPVNRTLHRSVRTSQSVRLAEAAA